MCVYTIRKIIYSSNLILLNSIRMMIRKVIRNILAQKYFNLKEFRMSLRNLNITV